MTSRTDFNNDAGRRLRAIRKLANVTQAQLAGAITATGQRMHPSAVAKIESGERPMSLSEAVRFSQYLGVPLNDLFSDGSAFDDARVRAQVAVANRERAVAEREIQLDAAVSNLEASKRYLASLNGSTVPQTAGAGGAP